MPHLPGRDDALYPDIEPYAEGRLDVGDGHHIHFEQCGNPAGLPVLFLHGGPGSGCHARQRRFFDPARYRIVLFDQRGCGRSTPRGSIADNTTGHLLADIEALRRHLGIDCWLLFGGSWGSSLALAYAGGNPAACRGMILRGIFFTGREDLDWFFRQSAQLLPEAAADFTAVVPERRRLEYCAQALSGEPADHGMAVAHAWARYEDAAMGFGTGQAPCPPTTAVTSVGAERARFDKYRIQSFYLTRRCFLGPTRLLRLAARCGNLPTAIIHGRRDLVCPPANAWRLHGLLPGSRLRLLEQAGHSPFDPAQKAALVSATDHFAAHGDFRDWT